jgi:hypothetical protein
MVFSMDEQQEQRLWRCQDCGFTSPWWLCAPQFPLCTRCEAVQRARRLAPFRAELERDRVKAAALRGNAPPGYIGIGRIVTLRESPKALHVRAVATGVMFWAPRAAILLADDGSASIRRWLFQQLLKKGIKVLDEQGSLL